MLVSQLQQLSWRQLKQHAFTVSLSLDDCKSLCSSAVGQAQ